MRHVASEEVGKIETGGHVVFTDVKGGTANFKWPVGLWWKGDRDGVKFLSEMTRVALLLQNDKSIHNLSWTK